MGIINKGILGPVSGTVGTVVGEAEAGKASPTCAACLPLAKLLFR